MVLEYFLRAFTVWINETVTSAPKRTLPFVGNDN